MLTFANLTGCSVSHSHVVASEGLVLSDNGDTLTVAWTWGTCETKRERIEVK